MGYPLFNAFLPQFYQNAGKANNEHTPNSVVYRNYAITSIVGVPGSFIAAYTVDVKYIGRKYTIAISTLITGILLFCFTISSDSNFQLTFGSLEAFFQSMSCHSPSAMFMLKLIGGLIRHRYNVWRAICIHTRGFPRPQSRHRDRNCIIFQPSRGSMCAHCCSACWWSESECTNLCLWVINHRGLPRNVLLPHRDKRKTESVVDAFRGTGHSDHAAVQESSPNRLPKESKSQSNRLVDKEVSRSLHFQLHADEKYIIPNSRKPQVPDISILTEIIFTSLYNRSFCALTFAKVDRAPKDSR